MQSLVLFVSGNCPVHRCVQASAIASAVGLADTIFSECLNIDGRESWAYSDLMPVIPLIDTGLSPVTQWIVIPTVGFWWARRAKVTAVDAPDPHVPLRRSEEHTSELQSLMRISYAVFCLKKKTQNNTIT